MSKKKVKKQVYLSRDDKVILIHGYLRQNIKYYSINDFVNVVLLYCLQKFYWDKQTL